MKNMIKKIMSSRGRIFNSDVVISANLKKYSRDCFGALLLAMTMFVTACDNKEAPAVDAKPTIKIGAILPLSGNFSELGNNAKAAIEIAQKEAISLPISFQFIFEDYVYEPKKAAIAVNKLVNIDKVNAMIPWSSPAANVAAPVADSAKIVSISITNGLSAAKGKYNFINFASSEALVNKLIKQIEEKGDIKSIAMFVAYQPSMQQTSDLLEKKLKEKGIKIVRESFMGDNNDFALTIEKTKLKNVDAWFIYASSPSADFFIRDFFMKKVNKPLFAIDTYFLMQDTSLVEGMSFVTAGDGDSNLLNKVSKITGSNNSFGVTYTYDAAKLLIRAYSDLYNKNNKIPTSGEVVEYLLSLKSYKGAIGDIVINSNGVLMSDAVIKQIKNGKVVLVEEK